MNLTRNRVEKYKNVDRDENRHTFFSSTCHLESAKATFQNIGSQGALACGFMQPQSTNHVHLTPIYLLFTKIDFRFDLSVNVAFRSKKMQLKLLVLTMLALTVN